VSPLLLVTLVVTLLMAQKLTQIYMGGRYVCPSCGARSQGNHSPDCPWSHTPSG
jgi:hypothetical protein